MIHTSNNIRVRYAETDRMDVVYHANYLVWFETARIKMLDQIGLPYREIENQGLFLPVLNISVEYKIPARFDDILDIHIFMTKLSFFFTCFIFFNKEYNLILIIGGKIRKKS